MFNFGLMGCLPSLGDVAPPVGVAPAAPLMTWASTSSDSTPDFDIDLPSGVGDGTDAAAGDVLHIQYSDDAWVTPQEYVSYTLLSGDITADTISESGISAIADGSYVFRARLERSGVGNSAWTSDVSVTIDTALPLAPTYEGEASAIHSSAVLTATAAAIGSAFANRRVFVVYAGSMGDASVSASDVTITPSGGSPITATIHYTSVGFNDTAQGIVIASALVPTATTADIAVTMSQVQFSNGIVATYSVDDSKLTSTTPTDTAYDSQSAASTDSISLTASAGGFMLGAVVGFVTGGYPITGATADYTENHYTMFSASSLTAGSHSVSMTAGASSAFAMAGAAFR